MNLSDMIENYEFMVRNGIKEDRAAIMAGAFAIARVLNDGLSRLTSDYSLGSLDLQNVHICEALSDIADSIESLTEAEE